MKPRVKPGEAALLRPGVLSQNQLVWTSELSDEVAAWVQGTPEIFSSTIGSGWGPYSLASSLMASAPPFSLGLCRARSESEVVSDSLQLCGL